LRRNIFESNVRDYQGATQVNEEISKTLGTTAGPEDFWWLNNGVTILCGSATHSGKILTIEDPQIVNSLQTSNEVYKNFSKKGILTDDERNILVRVIVPTDGDSRD
jgi:hypothetical protein